jgi:hypothetical protein
MGLSSTVLLNSDPVVPTAKILFLNPQFLHYQCLEFSGFSGYSSSIGASFYSHVRVDFSFIHGTIIVIVSERQNMLDVRSNASKGLFG